MRRPTWLLAITAFLLVAGASWFAALLWKTTELDGRGIGPHIVGALVGGFTLARVAQKRVFVLASVAALAWIALQLLMYRASGGTPKWSAGTTVDQLSLLLAIAPACAAVAAAIPLHTRETRWRWLVVSALLTLGCVVTPLVAMSHEESVAGALLVVGAPLFAGALTQYLATYRMIWTCGGGMLVFMLFLIDQRDNLPADSIIGPFAGVTMYALFGAAGAALTWRIFRNKDPRTPTTLPTATTVT